MNREPAAQQKAGRDMEILAYIGRAMQAADTQARTRARRAVATCAARSDRIAVKNFTAIALLLASCQSMPTDAVILQQLQSRALAFVTTMEANDPGAGIQYAAPSARGFFEASQQIRDMQWDDEEPRPPAAVALKSAKREGDRGVVVVSMTRDGNSRDLTLHFDLDNNVWGAIGFSMDSADEMQLFADREAQLREVLARAAEEAKPHAELGPFVTAYLAAGAKKDKGGMTASMTDECKKSEMRDSSFTSGFLAGRFTVKRWGFARHEIEGNTATQNIRTLLEMADGETDREPMRFSFEKTAAGWVITGIR